MACKPQTKPESIEETDQSLSVNEVSDSVQLVLADSLFQLGEKFLAKNQNDSALLFHQKALEIREKFLENDERLVESYVRVADFYLKEFKYESAAKHLEKAIFNANELVIPKYHLIDLNFRLADCMSNMKDLPMAISLLKKNIQLINENYPDDKILKAKAYGLLSSANYISKKYEIAIENAQIAIKLVSNENNRLGSYYANMGMAYRDMRHYEKALYCFNEAIKFDLAWAGNNSEPVARRYLQKAFIYRNLNQFDSALYYYLRNLQIRKKLHGEKSIFTFGAQFSLGDFFFQNDNFDSALYYYHQSLISLIKTFDKEHYLFNPYPSYDEMNTNLILGLVGKASSLMKIALRDSVNRELLKLSLKTYFLADSTFSIYRRNFINDDPQLAQLESEYIPYANMVEACFLLYHQYKDLKYIEYALNIMKRSRNVLLQSAINRVEAYGRAGISSKYQREENRLRSVRESILHQLNAPGKSKAAVDSLYNELAIINNGHRLLLKNIESENPAFFSIKYSDSNVQLSTILKNLAQKNAIAIEFLCKDDIIHGIMISSDSIKIKSIKVTDEMNDALRSILQVSNTEAMFSHEAFKLFCENSRLLYISLFNDLLPDLNENSNERQTLIISADGKLASFPFEILITKDPNISVIDYRLPYLIHKYSIVQVYSLEMLVKQSDKPRVAKRLLGFGYSYNSWKKNENVPSSLPGTEDEINTIKKLLKNEENQFFIGEDAKESIFKKKSNDFNLLHLAIHGVGDTLNPLEARLLFQSSGDTIDDGKLYAYELYDLNLEKLELAVLSACESGIGKNQIGEGIMSISRGFAYAGCPSQVISLWKIDDQATVSIMEAFYKYLLEGRTIDFSLSQAKLDYLIQADELVAHPFFWAAFLAVGDTSEIRFQRPYGYRVFGYVLISLLGLFTLIRLVRVGVKSIKVR